MPVLTILSHGTSNSTNVNTSEGHVLVITQLALVQSGAQGTHWILNEGAGTKELRNTGVQSSGIAGVAKGEGVEANVTRSVQWVKTRMAELNAPVTVNLAGHSRGSITCYKIARALNDDTVTMNIPVNIFAIDPVPGNTGRMNKENHQNIALGPNVVNSFLMLAESEHRLVFRPYIDSLYSVGRDNHKMDTIPGTHGGINMLGGPEKEAAAIVLSRAIKFLKKKGSLFANQGLDFFILEGKARLKTYAELMSRIKKYKARATVNPFRGLDGIVNFAMSGFQVEKHRTANVVGPKDAWGKQKLSTTVTDEGAATRSREDHHGLNMSTAIGRINPNEEGDIAHAARPHRFFANFDHQALFQKHYGTLFGTVQALERSGQDKAKLKSEFAAGNGDYNNMTQPEKDYLVRFLVKRVM